MTGHMAKAIAARVARAVLRRSTHLREEMLRAGAMRGRSLVLCYHTVAPAGTGERVIDPVPPERFAEQIRALRRVGDIVPLAELLSSPGRHHRPRLAITFDDDDPSHVRYALPVLRTLGVPATFFLSGRSLHGLGPYWWTLLEQWAAERGLEAACRAVGHRAGSVRELARICRSRGGVQDLDVTAPHAAMPAGDIRVLADAGMTIGFHTLHHLSLPRLDDGALAAALVEGREALRAAAGTDLDFLAYPYGHADARVADAARRAGYRAAFMTGERAMPRDGDPLLRPRWQPGAMPPEALLAEAALRMAAPGGTAASARTGRLLPPVLRLSG